MNPKPTRKNPHQLSKDQPKETKKTKPTLNKHETIAEETIIDQP